MAGTRRRSKVATLHPVGVGDDGLSVLLASRATATTPAFRLPIDAALLEHLQEAKRRVARPAPAAEPRAAPRPPPAESKLSIKEIQTLLRQGRSVASVAKRAGVDEAWVERFEGPIVWERAGTATRAQRATLTRPRSGRSALPLGEAVAANLKRRGIEVRDPEGEGWDSVRRPRKGTWIVSFTFSHRGRTNIAKWEFDPDSSELRALNASASQLGWVYAKGRRR